MKSLQTKYDDAIIRNNVISNEMDSVKTKVKNQLSEITQKSSELKYLLFILKKFNCTVSKNYFKFKYSLIFFTKASIFFPNKLSYFLIKVVKTCLQT